MSREKQIDEMAIIIKGVWCLFYFKVNTDNLSIDVIAIKEDNRLITDSEEEREDE